MEAETATASRRQWIAKVLSSALRLWLKTQVEQIADLQVEVQSGDRRLLSGVIQQVSLSAQQVVYQGLHLTQLNLVAANIRVNLGQVLRGKPLRILEPIPITGSVCIQVTDLNASLQTPLLAEAVTAFLGTLLNQPPHPLEQGVQPLSIAAVADLSLRQLQVEIAGDRVILQGLLNNAGEEIPVELETGLTLRSPQELQLTHLRWLAAPGLDPGVSRMQSRHFSIDLGSEVELHQLRLESGVIHCQAKLTVIP
ncbi:hypothetical protein DO97_11980 [Neosynechococcus sphagnicola sy1]|uniref:DUF2993 domain-containing protein n=1 Tax=Neosynechococcus sphagnicola sy1 TaxID=1497020 RepID=A0A098THV4_9CYAN|nr:hypothetical protein DO97_11980 [Neosynechococcus sphagnicola sy1]